MAVPVLPSPKSHRRLVIIPVDASVNLTVKGAIPVVGAAEKAATGGAGELTIIYPFRVSVLDPPGPLTASRISYVPALLKVNALDPSGVNVFQVGAEVSLYCHVRVVIEPVDESVKVTFNGAVPLWGVAENDATGGAAVTVIS